MSRQRRSERVLASLGLLRPDAGTFERRLLLTTLSALCLAVGGWLTALAFMSTVPFNGDEKFYVRNAAAIADLLTGRGGTPATVARALVAKGWFMPGVSFALAPLYALDPEPGVAVVRAYAAGVLFLLWLWTLREVAGAFGRYGAVALLVFPTLAGMWLMFATSIWGDLPAGLLLAIATARTFRIAVRICEERPVGVRDVLVLELVMAAMVYLRGNTIVAVVAGHAFLLGLAVISAQWSRLLRRVGVLAGGLAVFAVLLAPWSLVASRVLGGTVVTTSSTPLSIAITFGDTDKICFGRCPGEGVWYWAVRYSRAYGKQHGISQLEAQRAMAAYALRDVTFAGYAEQARANLRSFVTPTGPAARQRISFVERFVSLNTRDFSSLAARNISVTVESLTLVLYVPFFAALVLANAAVVVRPKRAQILSLCVKIFTFALFLQPFVHRSHARYWVGFAPLMAIAAVFLLNWWSVRRARPVAGGHMATDSFESYDLDAAGRIMVGTQAAYVGLVGAIAMTLWWA